jgi:hypothetical protein
VDRDERSGGGEQDGLVQQGEPGLIAPSDYIGAHPRAGSTADRGTLVISLSACSTEKGSKERRGVDAHVHGR